MGGEGGGHGEVGRVAGAVAADEGEDEEGGCEVEDEGCEERREEGLGGVSGCWRVLESVGLECWGVIVLGSDSAR